MPIQYPMINNHRYDFSSIELVINGRIFSGFTSLSYDDGCEPGEARGNRAQLIGRTRGKYEANASFEMHKLELRELIAFLGPGYYEKAFNITANYVEAVDVNTDTVVGARMKKIAEDYKEGGDALIAKVDLSVMYIMRNGIIPLEARQFLR